MMFHMGLVVRLLVIGLIVPLTWIFTAMPWWCPFAVTGTST
jgi:hypothetical protein